MAAVEEGTRARHRRAAPTDVRRRRGRWPWLVLAAAVLLVAAAGWMFWTGWQARNSLVDAEQQAAVVRTALLSSDPTASQVAVQRVVDSTDRAKRLTAGPVWRVVAAVPWFGRTAEAVRSSTATADRLAHEVLPGLVQVREALDPSTLRPSGDRLDVTALAAAEPQLTALAGRARSVAAEAAALPTAGVPPVVANAVHSLGYQTGELAGTLDSAAQAARLLPPMLGADGARRYLLVFQNNAEARGTGGLIGAYGVLTADHGKVTLDHLGSNSELVSLRQPALDLGPAFRALYGPDPALWGNVNLSPDFPSAAALMLAMWQRQHHQQLDGVVATDPIALSYVLRATGPVRLPDGEEITADNAVDKTLREVYARWPRTDQDPQRNAYLQTVARAVFDRLLSGAGDSQALAQQLGRAVGERRLLVASAHPEEETELAATAVGGAIDHRPGPYAALVIDNAAGNKLDYYLDRRLDYALGSCSATTRGSTVTVTLTNHAPSSGLPAYASMRLDRGRITGGGDTAGGDGSTNDRVQVYTAVGAQLVSATLDGKPVGVTPGEEKGRPVFVAPVTLRSGQTATLVLHLQEPVVAGTPRVWVQPLVRPPVTSVSGPTCR